MLKITTAALFIVGAGGLDALGRWVKDLTDVTFFKAPGGCSDTGFYSFTGNGPFNEDDLTISVPAQAGASMDELFYKVVGSGHYLSEPWDRTCRSRRTGNSSEHIIYTVASFTQKSWRLQKLVP